MQTILRVLKSLFLPHDILQAEREFIEENTRHWHSVNLNPGILIETALSTPASLLEKFIIAKFIEQQCGISSIVLLNSIYKKASSAYGVATSFGMSRFFCWWQGYVKPWFVMRCVVQTLAIIWKIRTGEKLIGLRLNGIHVGDLLYDTLIRYRPNSYTVNKLSVTKHFRLIFRAIYNFYTSSSMFNMYEIKAVVTSHTVYAEFGILCRIAHARGAVVFLKDMDVFRVYKCNSNIYENFLKVESQELVRGLENPVISACAEEYFVERLGGRIDQIDLNNAYVGKRVYSKTELLDMFGLNLDKKNVFVLSHAFSDAPHVGGRLAFQDYYIWLRETLLMLSRNSEVNVFVKPHPSSYMWGEKGAVEKLLDKIGVANVYITPKDMNTLSISSIADYVVTVRGTAGLEYSGFGIPAITCGEGYYSGFGVAIEELSSKAYCDLLARITSIPPLSPEVSRKARILLYLTFTKLARSSIAPARHICPGDDANILIPANFREMTERLRAKGSYADDFTATVKMAISNAF